jgi:microcystin-dependent protein
MMKNFNLPNMGAGDVLTFDGNKWTAQQSIPAGTIVQFAGAAAPVGWLLCDGSAVSRATYAGLFAVLGTAYGAGNSTSTFNLPDLRGRVACGLDNMGGSDAGRLSYQNTLGTTGGSQTVSGSTDAYALKEADIPAHKHIQGFTVASNETRSRYGISDSGVNSYLFESYTQSTSTWGANTSTVGGNTGHSHTITGFDVMPPFILMNYIIKC